MTSGWSSISAIEWRSCTSARSSRLPRVKRSTGTQSIPTHEPCCLRFPSLTPPVKKSGQFFRATSQARSIPHRAAVSIPVVHIAKPSATKRSRRWSSAQTVMALPVTCSVRQDNTEKILLRSESSVPLDYYEAVASQEPDSRISPISALQMADEIFSSCWSLLFSWAKIFFRDGVRAVDCALTIDERFFLGLQTTRYGY